jgi:tetratricopeptide (TPR) repeat protein
LIWRATAKLLFSLAVAYVKVQTQTPGEWASEAERLIRAGKQQEGLAALVKAAELPGGSAESEDRIGFLFAVLGRQPEAAAHFKKSLAFNRDYAPAHYHLGVARWLAKDFQNGLPELEKAVTLSPSIFDYRFRLGSAYLQVGRQEQAVAELEQAVSIDKTQTAAWIALAQARNSYATSLIEMRQPERAIEQSQKVLAHDPANDTAQMNIGYAYLKMGEFDKAEKAYRAAIASDPKSAAAHYDLAIALKMQDQLEPAQKELQEVIRLDPSLAEAHYTLGITDWQSGDFVATIREMKAAIAIYADYAEAHYMLGIVLKQTGDLDAALPELKEAIRLDPTTPGPFNTLGQILRIKGDKQGSEEAFATGARLKREKEGQLANSLEQGRRSGTFPKPLAGPSR